MPCLHEVCTAFFSSRLSILCWSHISIPLCSKLWYCEVEVFFFTFQSWWIITHILTAFSVTFFTQFIKKTGYLLLGLSCKVFTLDHLFSHRSDFFNNMTISLTKWTEYRKNRCLSFSTNSVHLHFRERVEKTKIKRQKNENRKPTKWAGKLWREKIRAGARLGKKFKKFLQILVCNCFERLFRQISYLKEALNSTRKYNLQSERTFETPCTCSFVNGLVCMQVTSTFLMNSLTAE